MAIKRLKYSKCCIWNAGVKLYVEMAKNSFFIKSTNPTISKLGFHGGIDLIGELSKIGD